MRIDALVAEMFTSSQQIVGIYGYCGTGMINEPVTQGKMNNVAIPYDDHDYIDTVIEKFEEEGEVTVLNNLSGTEKLEYALEMAEAVALLHSYPGGVIVHDDVTLEQFLIDDEGHLKLNDFNRAEFMLWNDEDQEYCRYRNNPGKGEVRALYPRYQVIEFGSCALFSFSHLRLSCPSFSGALQKSMSTNP